MKSYDYEAVTTEDGEAVCLPCMMKRRHKYGWTKAEMEEAIETGFQPIFADSEWDCYPSCADCGRELDYVRLTADGEKYVAQRQARSPNPPMTRGHFELIAHVLKVNRPTSGTAKRELWNSIVEDMAAELARTSPNFDFDRFYRAATR